MSETGSSDRMVDIFLRYLKAEGARVVFGVPGGLLHPFFAAIEQDPDLRLIVVKHEEGAAFMADGYARVGRRLSVCAGTAGPGATNLLTGVAVAHSDAVPLLVITGQAPSYLLGKGAAQETPAEDIDIVAMFKPITKYSAMIPAPHMVGHHLRRALRLALAGRPGPVHLNIPVDFWAQPASEEWFEPSTYRPTTDVFDRAKVQQASRALLSAAKPCVLVGSGVATAGAEETVRTLAELLPARVATSPRGKGLFPEDHPLSMGVMGFAGHREAVETLTSDDVDVLLTVGASLNETTTLNFNPALRPSRALIQADISIDRIGRNYPVDVPLVGDAHTILVELVYHIHRLIRDGHTPASQWPMDLEVEPERRYLHPELRISDSFPLTPQRWRADLSAVLPSDAIVFSDIGGHMLFNLHYLEIRAGQRFVLNLGFGSMGHGTCAPVGAAMLEPRRPIVAIIGDACFTMNGMEMLTAAEYEIPVVWIVENNQMHGITWHGSKTLNRAEPMRSIVYRKPIEIAAIARAMGLNAWVVDRPGQIADVFTEAHETGEPCVIEVRVDRMISPPLADRAKTIAGFRKD